MNSINAELIDERLTPIRDAIDVASQTGLFDEEEVSYMENLVSELDNAQYSDQSAIICSRLRRELQNHDWEGIEEFFEAWGEDSETQDFSVAQSATFDAFYDFRNGEDLTEDDIEELWGQAWGGILACLYVSAKDATVQADDQDDDYEVENEDDENFESDLAEVVNG